MFNLIQSKDNLVLFRETDVLCNKVLLSTLFISSNSLTIKFLKDWSFALKPFLLGPWYSDQITFYKTFNKSNATIKNLNIEYCDFFHDDSSYIWCGKGGNKDSIWTKYYIEFTVYNILPKVKLFNNKGFFYITKSAFQLYHKLSSIKRKFINQILFLE